MAKTRKPASRAKKGTKKKSVKGTKKAAPKPKAMAAKSAKQVPSLDLKKLKNDIATAKEALAKRLPGADPQMAQTLMDTQAKLNQWASDIDSDLYSADNCGTTMVIS